MMHDHIRCPRCGGCRLVHAYIEPPTEFYRGRGEHFTCPLCAGTGECLAEDAAQWLADEREARGASDDP